MIKYQYVYTQNAKKEFEKIDSYQQKKIDTWITQRIENSVTPRQYGKALSGSLQKYWSYHIGNDRVICEIDDTQNHSYHYNRTSQ